MLKEPVPLLHQANEMFNPVYKALTSLNEGLKPASIIPSPRSLLIISLFLLITTTWLLVKQDCINQIVSFRAITDAQTMSAETASLEKAATEMPWSSDKIPPIVIFHCSLGPRFKEEVLYSLGDGSWIRFWENRWLGDCLLKDAFPSLAAIAVDKNVSIADCFSRNEGGVVWAPPCRKGLSDEEVEAFISLLDQLNTVSTKEGKMF